MYLPFALLTGLSSRPDFEQRYNATARPFQWKFTPTDLDDLLARIDQHQQPTAPNTIPQAA